MKHFLLVALLAASFSGVMGQTIQLSEHAVVSIMTFGPSQEELYSAFGHSGIRVRDSVRQIDAFFNYGVFDFEQPNFYLNFTRGHLLYSVAASSYAPYEEYYIAHHRFIHEQQLNLTPEQTSKIFNYLVWNIRPENKDYLYDYFYNNCATKVRDVFKDVLKSDVAFDSSHIRSHYTIRQLTDLYLSHQPWGDLGIDICLGLPMDKPAAPSEYMFLPDYLEAGFDHARNTSLGMPLVKKKIIAYSPPPETFPFSIVHPWIVFGALLLLIGFITYRDWKRQQASRLLDVVLFKLCGLLGLLLFILWVATDHHAAARNFNLLWAFPGHLVIVFFIWRRKKSRWMATYFLTTALVMALTLALWFVLPQALNVFLMPLVGILLLRSLLNYFLLKREVITVR